MPVISGSSKYALMNVVSSRPPPPEPHSREEYGSDLVGDYSALIAVGLLWSALARKKACRSKTPRM